MTEMRMTGLFAALRISGIILLAASSPASHAQGFAWDGRGTPEVDTSDPAMQAPKSRRVARPVPAPAAKKDADLDSLKPYSEQWWARKQEMDDADSKRLNRQMSICRSC
jgi:hypothetical protein